MPESPIAGRIDPKELPAPPDGLSDSAAKLWTESVEEFAFDPAELALLEAACWSWHRAEQARALLDEHGPITVADSGMHHPHPAVRIERDSWREFRLAWSKLGMVDPAGAGK